MARSTHLALALAVALLLHHLGELQAGEGRVLEQVLRALEGGLGLVELLLRELRDAEPEPVLAVAAEGDDLREHLLGLLVAAVLEQLLGEDAPAVACLPARRSSASRGRRAGLPARWRWAAPARPAPAPRDR